MLYCVENMPFTKPNPKPTDSVDQCKTDIKTMQQHGCRLHLNFLISRFELFCQTLVTRDSSKQVRIYTYKYVSILRELQNKPTVYETHMKLDMCDANVQKHQFSNLLEY